jgi:hypothetical protein
VTEWTCLWPVIPASHSAQQGNDSEQKTLVTSGHTSPDQFELFAPDSVSSRMSKDTSALDSAKSLESWKRSVIKRRGEYSLRVKLAHLTNASGCSSWPTAAVMDTMGGPYKTEFVDGVFRSYHNHSKEDAPKYGARLRDAVTTPVNWPTANARDWKDSITGTHPPSRPNLSEQTLGQAVSVAHGLPAPANPSTDGSRQESWATPRANKVHPEITEDNRDHLANRNKSNLEEEIAGHCGKSTGKLNPRWVETLMGLPIGWTMPSCTRPVTIEPTNSDSSATESCQPPQNEHLEH